MPAVGGTRRARDLGQPGRLLTTSPERKDRPIFGPIDPYVVPPVAALLGAATVVVLAGAVWLGLGICLLAGLLVVFDSWVNRGDRGTRHRVAPKRRSRR